MKMTKNLKRMLSLMIVFVLMVGIIPNFGTKAEAWEYNLYNLRSYTCNRGYAKAYTVATSGYTSVYSYSNLTYKMGTIYNWCDDIRVLDFDASNCKWVRVSYPVTGTNNRKTGYVSWSTIFGPGGCAVAGTSKSYTLCSIRRYGSTSWYYYIEPGDRVYVISWGNKGSVNTQVLYPTSDGKCRIAWCDCNQLNLRY